MIQFFTSIVPSDYYSSNPPKFKTFEQLVSISLIFLILVHESPFYFISLFLVFSVCVYSLKMVFQLNHFCLHAYWNFSTIVAIQKNQGRRGQFRAILFQKRQTKAVKYIQNRLKGFQAATVEGKTIRNVLLLEIKFLVLQNHVSSSCIVSSLQLIHLQVVRFSGIKGKCRPLSNYFILL